MSPWPQVFRVRPPKVARGLFAADPARSLGHRALSEQRAGGGGCDERNRPPGSARPPANVLVASRQAPRLCPPQGPAPGCISPSCVETSLNHRLSGGHLWGDLSHSLGLLWAPGESEGANLQFPFLLFTSWPAGLHLQSSEVSTAPVLEF